MGLLAGLGRFREFLFFFNNVNSVAYYAFARRFVSCSPRRYLIYRVERAGFGHHLFHPTLPMKEESEIVSYLPAP